MRIVSTTCSNTEIVCALGCADYLVGVDSDSDFPADVVAKLPRVGRDLDVEADKIAALKPDLVLASLTVPGHEQVIARLQAAGLPYLATEPVSLEDVFADIQLIAEHLQAPARAQQVIGNMRAEMQNACGESATPPKILVQWWPKPVIAPGKLSWVHDMLTAVGASNPLAAREVKSMPLKNHEVVALDPDALVISWCGVKPEKYRPDVISANPELSALRAVREARIFCIPEAYLGRPGPRLLEGLKALRHLTQRLAEA